MDFEAAAIGAWGDNPGQADAAAEDEIRCDSMVTGLHGWLAFQPGWTTPGA